VERSWDRIHRPPLKRARYIIHVYARRMWGWDWMRVVMGEVRAARFGCLVRLMIRGGRMERSCFNLAVRRREGW
jgi:hypothetical protein